MKISPSILSADFANLKEDVTLMEKAGAEYIHIDVMDGQFVSSITFGANVVQALRPHTKMVMDVHLMIENPENQLVNFSKAGADILMVHAEATKHLYAVLQEIKRLKMKPGVVINPGTPVSFIEPVLGIVDQVLVMTVNPGFGGQKFLPDVLEKITELKNIREEKNYSFDIEVDGGITDKTAPMCAKAGADVFVAGSYLYNSEDPVESLHVLRESL